ncbi:MAG: sugar transferase [Rhodothermales bacterium]
MKDGALDPRDSVPKRLFDVLASAAGLILLSPLIVAVAVAVKLYDRGPVLYKSLRIGKGGRRFHLFKFRTMVVDADRQGPGITTARDPRVTPVGRFLRRYKLDELPQLIHVLKGEMSFVGPRPEDPRYVARYTPDQRRVLAARPGITGIASLAYRREEELLVGPDWERLYCEEILPAKLALELDYLSRRTFWSDIGLILQTLKALFVGSIPV